MGLTFFGCDCIVADRAKLVKYHYVRPPIINRNITITVDENHCRLIPPVPLEAKGIHVFSLNWSKFMLPSRPEIKDLISAEMIDLTHIKYLTQILSSNGLRPNSE